MKRFLTAIFGLVILASSVWPASLPQQLKTTRMTDATLARNIDDEMATFEQALAAIFGFTLDTNVTESPTSFDNSGRFTKALLRAKAAGPVGWRILDSTSGKEIRIVVNGSNFDLDENTGTEGSPTWTNRGRFPIAANASWLVPGVATASLSITAGSVGRITDGAASGALVMGDGTNANCLEAKSQKIAVITCPPYKAKGDDTNDDTAEIQAALDSGLKEIFVPAGTYKVSASLVPPTGVTISGVGETSIIKSAASIAWADTGLIQVPVTSANVRVRDLVVDGNKANNATGRSFGIFVKGASSVWIERVRSINHPGSDAAGTNGGDGFYVGRDTATDTIPDSIYLIDSIADGNVRQGLSIVEGKNVVVRGGAYRNTTGTNPGAGIDIEPNASASANRIVGVTIDGVEVSGNNYGIAVFATGAGVPQISGVAISNVKAFSNVNQGIRVVSASTDDIIRGVKIVGSEVHDNGEEGILVSSGATIFLYDSIVAGNYIHDNGKEGIKTNRTERTAILGKPSPRQRNRRSQHLRGHRDPTRKPYSRRKRCLRNQQQLWDFRSCQHDLEHDPKQ